jgi:cyclophilin family peptidyl-prolyl cis-trans isomerase
MKNLLAPLILLCIISCSGPKKTSVAGGRQVKLQLTTAYGTMVIKLYNETPLHRDNFVKLVRQHFFDSLLFHRVDKGFMIQGGDPDSRHAKPGQHLGEGSLSYTLAPEFDTALFHKKGALAAAREADAANPKKRSNASQFYIVEGKTFTDAEMDKMQEKLHIKIPENHRRVYRTSGGAPFLDMNYTVFGEVVSGFEVIDKIAGVAKDNNDRPLQNIAMKIIIVK